MPTTTVRVDAATHRELTRLAEWRDATGGETGALAWASTKVNISNTGEWIRLPKFENTVTEFPRDEHQHVIKLTPIDGDGGGGH